MNTKIEENRDPLHSAVLSLLRPSQEKCCSMVIFVKEQDWLFPQHQEHRIEQLPVLGQIVQPVYYVKAPVVVHFLRAEQIVGGSVLVEGPVDNGTKQPNEQNQGRETEKRVVRNEHTAHLKRFLQLHLILQKMDQHEVT